MPDFEEPRGTFTKNGMVIFSTKENDDEAIGRAKGFIIKQALTKNEVKLTKSDSGIKVTATREYWL